MDLKVAAAVAAPVSYLILFLYLLGGGDMEGLRFYLAMIPVSTVLLFAFTSFMDRMAKVEDGWVGRLFLSLVASFLWPASLLFAGIITVVLIISATLDRWKH